MSQTRKSAYQQLRDKIMGLTGRVEKLEAGHVQINVGVVASDAEVRALRRKVATDVAISTRTGQHILVGGWMTVRELEELLVRIQQTPEWEMSQGQSGLPPKPSAGGPPPY